MTMKLYIIYIVLLYSANPLIIITVLILAPYITLLQTNIIEFYNLYIYENNCTVKCV